MREDVAADGLAAIGPGEEGAGAGVGLHLVRLPTNHSSALSLSKRAPRMGEHWGVCVCVVCDEYHQDAKVELLGHVRQL